MTSFGLTRALFCALAVTTIVAQAADPLPSWNDGKSKQSILTFVSKVTKEGSPEFVPPAERIATFPTKPADAKEGTWIQTTPGKGWFVVLRLYSPLESFFDKSWRPTEIESVK